MTLKYMDQRNEARESLKSTRRKLDAERAENIANKKVVREAILAKNNIAHRLPREKSTFAESFAMIWGRLMSTISQPKS